MLVELVDRLTSSNNDPKYLAINGKYAIADAEKPAATLHEQNEISAFAESIKVNFVARFQRLVQQVNTKFLKKLELESTLYQKLPEALFEEHWILKQRPNTVNGSTVFVDYGFLNVGAHFGQSGEAHVQAAKSSRDNDGMELKIFPFHAELTQTYINLVSSTSSIPVSWAPCGFLLDVMNPVTKPLSIARHSIFEAEVFDHVRSN